jgi:hypothetical protein
MSNVNLSITSAVGFRRSSTQTLVFPDGSVSVGGYNSPRPLMTTTFTLEGIEQPDIVVSGTRILSVTTTTPFVMFPTQTSNPQQIFLTNQGDSPLSLVFPFFQASNDGVNFPDIDFEPSDGIIPPGFTGTMTVSYTAEDQIGEFFNWILIITDGDNQQVKLITKQLINDQFNASISPNSYNTVTNSVGERSYVTYVLTPLVNEEERPDITLDFSYTLTEGTGWKVFSTSTNAITLEFESNDIGNQNGSYYAELSLAAAGAVTTLANIATVDINFESNYNLFQWVSPISYHNSLIGISYDVIDNEKTLTIGVGMGGDGSPEYDMGGENYIEMRNLGIGANNIDNPYLYWAEAYRFRNLGTGTAKTYLSGAQDSDSVYLYQEKFTEERNYSYYFGNERSFGSMFIVEDDGTGNLTININNIREYSEDEEFNVTLDNLIRAFHYYSGKDIGDRIVNLIQYPLFPAISPPTVAATTSTVTPSGENRTNLFRGIDYINKEQVAVAAAASTVGQTTITLTALTGLSIGDLLYYIDAVVVEGRLLKIVNINFETNVVTLSSALTSSVNLGSTVGFKNPITAKTSLVKIPS